MQQMPDQLRVGGLTYPVALDTERNYNAEAEGLCDLRHTRIWIHAGISRQRRRLTLLHEALHAVLGEGALTAGESPLLDAELEERVVASMAHGLFALLRDNPEFVAFVTEKEHA